VDLVGFIDRRRVPQPGLTHNIINCIAGSFFLSAAALVFILAILVVGPHQEFVLAI
jgi:hypothetical protein